MSAISLDPMPSNHWLLQLHQHAQIYPLFITQYTWHIYYERVYQFCMRVRVWIYVYTFAYLNAYAKAQATIITLLRPISGFLTNRVSIYVLLQRNILFGQLCKAKGKIKFAPVLCRQKRVLIA